MMKTALKLRSIIAIVLILCTAMLALVSCDFSDISELKDNILGEFGPDAEQEEEEEVVLNEIALITEGKVNFQIVKTAKLGSKGIKKVNAFVEQLESLDLEVDEPVDDKDVSAVKEYEIIIGYGAVNRPGCDVDFHEIGEDGYIIKVVGTKVVIAGGSDDAVADAIDVFCKKVLKITAKVDTLEDATITMKTSKTYKRRTEYDVTDIKVGADQISLNDGYYLDYDVVDRNISTAGNLVREEIFLVSGIWLPLTAEMPEGETPEHVISIKAVADAGPNAFRISVDDNSNIVIECQTEHISGILKGVNAFLDKTIRNKKNAIRIYADMTFTYAINVVRYIEFGAKGDGKTDDFEAIKKTHEYANENGMKVLEDAGKTYFIGPDSYGKHINVKTDVDWGSAKFIIDDYNLTPYTKTGSTYDRARNVFYIVSDSERVTLDPSMYEGISLKAGSVEEGGTANVGMTFSGTTMLGLTYTGQKVFIRWGGNANNGGNTYEQIIVSANGDISPETPLAFSYPRLDDVTALLVDDTPITIKGGTFTTWANQVCYDFPDSSWLGGNQYYYYNRGIGITRSNVTITGQKHYVEREGEKGYPYSAWFGVGTCYNTLITDCVVTGHKAYLEERPGGGGTTMGSYDLSASGALKVVWKNVKQSNSITDQGLWGVMGSNNCKNLTYDGCSLSRFDAHNGTYNAYILNTDIGFDINLIGWGEAVIKNTTIHSGDRVAALRVDYGATWRGTIKVINVTMKGYAKISGGEINTNTKPLKDYGIIDATWKDHEFGNLAYLPSIEIDGLNLPEGALSVTLYRYSDLSSTSFDYKNPKNANPLYYSGSAELPTYKAHVALFNCNNPSISYYMSSAATYLDDLLRDGQIADLTPEDSVVKVQARS